MTATEQEKALDRLCFLAQVVNVQYDSRFHVWPIKGDSEDGTVLRGVGIRRLEDTAPDMPRAAVMVTETEGEIWYQVRLALGESERAECDDTAMDSLDRALCMAFGALSDLWLLETIQRLEAGVHVIDGDSPEVRAAVEMAMAGVVRH